MISSCNAQHTAIPSTTSRGGSPRATLFGHTKCHRVGWTTRFRRAPLLLARFSVHISAECSTGEYSRRDSGRGRRQSAKPNGSHRSSASIHQEYSMAAAAHRPLWSICGHPICEPRSHGLFEPIKAVRPPYLLGPCRARQFATLTEVATDREGKFLLLRDSYMVIAGGQNISVRAAGARSSLSPLQHATKLQKKDAGISNLFPGLGPHHDT